MAVCFYWEIVSPTFKNGARGSACDEFTSTDTRFIFAKKKEFSSEDAINVSADEEDASECCNPDNSKPKQHTSPCLQAYKVLFRKSHEANV